MCHRKKAAAAVVCLAVTPLLRCTPPAHPLQAAEGDLASLVDPFIGTGGHGHTFPGATAPYGMVQLSPDTRTEGWDACAAYHASDRSIMGFSHTHLSGTGASDYGDILLMPSIGTDALDPGPLENPSAGYRSMFRKEAEWASPGFYKVLLDTYGIAAELTATPRVGMHRYRFPASLDARILFDLEHRANQTVKEAYVEVLSATEIAGLRRSSDWARDQYVYFYAQFSKPMKRALGFLKGRGDVYEVVAGSQRLEGERIKFAAYFDTSEGEEISVKVALSAVSAAGAQLNMQAELDHWDFDRVRLQTRQAWNSEIGKISVASREPAKLRKFYTAMYHAMIAPNLFMDADGGYRGMDQQTHIASDFTNYTVFSLWDTYRALHPLLTLIDHQRTNQFIRTFLKQYEASGSLPIWELAGNETGTMIGYHAVPVIADAYLKGIRDYDVSLAFEAMKESAESDRRGLDYYKALGYVPHDKEGEAVSKTLEYAYDDWTIAAMAASLGKSADAAHFGGRAQNYRNLFDAETSLMRPRLHDGSWLEPFDPYNADHRSNGFTEANALQYSWSVPQDIPGHIELLGGQAAFGARLDAFFTDNTPLPDERSPDISGMIGQYAHGNEPSHHIAYLYQHAGRAHDTERMVRRIMDELYTTAEDGLSGNEDCGQMSAWFIFSALGFYPVTPGSGRYTLGSPLVDSAVIQLENGRHFTVTAHGQSATAREVSRVLLNGQEIHQELEHDDIMAGGELEFYMSETP